MGRMQKVGTGIVPVNDVHAQALNLLTSTENEPHTLHNLFNETGITLAISLPAIKLSMLSHVPCAGTDIMYDIG